MGADELVAFEERAEKLGGVGGQVPCCLRLSRPPSRNPLSPCQHDLYWVRIREASAERELLLFGFRIRAIPLPYVGVTSLATSQVCKLPRWLLNSTP